MRGMRGISPLLALAVCDSRGGCTAINAGASGQLLGMPGLPASRAARHGQRGATTRPSRRSGLSSETDSGLSGVLRHRRNEEEYPHLPADTATLEEAGTAQRLTNRHRGQVAVSTVLLRPRPGQDQELWDHGRKIADGIVPAMLPAFARPAQPS